MLQYITESEYVKLLDAESIPDNFNTLAIEASYIINKRYVVNETPSTEVKYAAAKIVELLDSINATKLQVGSLSSTSIEGWSETYKTDTEIEEDKNKSINNILDLYLSTVPRRSKGVILCE